MKQIIFITLLTLLLFPLCPEIAGAQETSATQQPAHRVVSVKPEYLPPSEILDFLGAHEYEGRLVIEWTESDGTHFVEIRQNDVANLIILTGVPADIEFIENLIRKADIAPRQIEIQIEIIEINDTKARDIGLDWQEIIEQALPAVSYRYYDSREQLSDYEYNKYRKRVRSDLNLDARVNLSRAIKVLDESGVANIKSTPKILTLNNRCATILDGQRVTYVTRYSSYTNLFETDSMDAGLVLKVCPSVGESGYITLDVNAEYTSLGSSISGSPIKAGQLIENTIIVKDGESVLLGGLSRTVEEKRRIRFPLLGHILPFIFSREIKDYENVESFMILTPRVVDLSPPTGESTIETNEEG